MSIPYYIEHGNRTYLELPGLEISKRARALDSLRRSIRTDAEDTFRDGGALPGFPHMRLKEVVSRKDGPGWMHEISAEGLRNGSNKLESSSLAQPEEGWDEGPQTWLTVQPDAFIVGSEHPDIPTLWLASLDSKEDLNGHVWRVSANYKGYIPDSDGNIKPDKWKITVNGQTITTSGTLYLGHATPEIFTDENGVYNGWTDARKATFDTSAVNIIRTVLSATPPPTDRVGLSLTPDRIPAIFSIFDLPTWFAAGFTYNYPAGWKLAGVQSDQVLDKAAYLYTLTYEYQSAAIPTL